MERMGADDPLAMARHGRSLSIGRAGGFTRTSDAAPRGISPSKSATSVAKALSVVRVSNASKADGDAEGASPVGFWSCSSKYRPSVHMLVG